MTFDDLRRLCPSHLTLAEVRSLWAAIFRRNSAYDLFERILLGEDVDLPFDPKKELTATDDYRELLPVDARKFLENRWREEFRGKLDEDVCQALGIDYNVVREVAHTEAFRKYAVELGYAKLEEEMIRTGIALLRCLRRKLDGDDPGAIAEARMAFDGTIGRYLIPSRLSGGISNDDLDVIDADFLENDKALPDDGAEGIS